ncbi:unnamed protein product [Symbiodinium natans]|uniref:Uncharacterized protein n=1 Tax=Symbiodinium natans TaxID=878477 RepID=A0A812TAY5_9DINO|nr:unnamed protein product [Symbiodinium natans]
MNAMDMLITDSEEEEEEAPNVKVVWPKAPSLQEWAEVLPTEGAPETPRQEPRGQVRQITPEVRQDEADPTRFCVEGKDRSWFLQKGGVVFDRPRPDRFRLDVTFSGGLQSRFGDDYAELSRAEQSDTINWLVAVGVARHDAVLTGYKDCKTTGFYFIFHLNYRRTRWRIVACPHNAELEDLSGQRFSCDPQEDDQFELDAYEGQTLSVEFAEGELFVAERNQRRALGKWAFNDGSTRLPDVKYFPAVLTSNCPTSLTAVVAA